ncbi:aspartate/glutamate racemase family protein [Candidatus Entotheonella palauensis]|uniref:aspartate/glutamate racemase family protein n=1 Tax=Candidatus Entotheonella palauensis TaxID=93172 RepID=UPI000B7E9E98|nr:aspartate/glutamate racemase family protein [Candidatus Entotheonella palauensis]
MSEAGPLGILLLDTRFPRGPGDIGNAASYDFPVILKTVPGATVDRVVKTSDPALLTPFIQAAKELEAQRVCAITTSCGFLAPFQAEVTEALRIPVFLSSLMQIPLVYMMTRRRVGVITANRENLTDPYFRAAGVPADLPLAISGLEVKPAFRTWILEDSEHIDTEAVQREVLEAAQELADTYSDIGAFVCECHNLAPYAPAVAKAMSRPVFDVISFAHWVYSSMAKREFR